MPLQADARLEPIRAGDDEIRRALAEAHIPSLVLALVHLTDDASLIHGDIQLDSNFFGDPQCGISPDKQDRVRALALEVLRDLRDGRRTMPPPPGRERIFEMMKFLIGPAATGDYVDFLESELALDGRDAYAPEPFDAIPADRKRNFHVVVIGAGMSGILAAIRLAEAGIPFTVVEKNAEVGGTWFENTYPGCRVDSPNHTYSYSFAPKDWPQHFCEQKVLLGYFDEVATRFGVRDRIRFETEVTSARFDAAAKRWRVAVRTRSGAEETIEANAVVAAVGQLNRPRFPDIPGRERFRGPAFHSAQWRHDVDLAGKRVGVIGTGASAFQFVPIVTDRAEHVTIFQRTPPWVSPRAEYFQDIPAGKHWLLNHVPYYAKWYRFFMFWRTSEGLLGSVRRDPSWNDEVHSVSPQNDALRQLLTAWITEVLGDRPDLLEKAVPDYPPAGKRMLVDDGRWLRTLKRENVTLTDDPIREITETGIVTEGGVRHEFDVIVYGTGFQASDFLVPMKIYGRDGRELHEHWNGDARAYLGITVPGYPNLFCMYGPNTNIVVNGSIIFFSECEMRYIMGCLRLLLASGRDVLDCRSDVHDRYNERIDAGNREMAWGSPHVSSWYKNRKGRVTQNWPFTLLEYWAQTRKPDPQDYALS